MEEQNPQKKIEGMTRIVLRPLASPLPLAFFAFGAGSLMLSGLQLGMIPVSETRSVALVQAAFVFPPMVLSSVLAFLSRETLGATIMALISSSWLANGLIDLTTPPTSTNATQGLLALAPAAILLLVGAGAVFGKPLLGLVIALASARFATTGLYELSAATGLQTASDVLGCVIAVIALYGGLALGLEDLQGKPVLPIGRRGAARRAFEGDLGEQVGPIESEAGVRKQLQDRVPGRLWALQAWRGAGVIEIWGRANSLNVQKVLWCLGELGVPFERYDAGGLYGVNKEPDFLSRNPTGLVPLLSEDGFDLWESNTIVRYLAARHGAGSLWPEDPAARALSEKWMDYQLGTVFPAFKDAVLGLIRTPPENRRDPEKIAASVRATAETLAVLDTHLQDREYVAGDSLTVGDVALGPTIYRWLTLDIDRPPMPNLQAWHDRLGTRPPYREHVMVPYRMESPA